MFQSVQWVPLGKEPLYGMPLGCAIVVVVDVKAVVLVIREVGSTTRVDVVVLTRELIVSL